jgi:anti-sigma regulatory factor (Ser/Thr protein kinase)
VANAGHLPPLLFVPGAEARPISEGTSPPIGVPVTGPRATAAFAVAAGASVLLLTDGLVEERGTDLGTRLTLVTERGQMMLATPDTSLSSVADALVHTREHREDDVTVLLARRPHEAVLPDDSARQPVSLLRVELDSDLSAVGAARRMVRDSVRTLATQLDEPVDPETVDALLLVTSELVTNGLRHGEPPVLLHLDRRGERLRLTVTDQGVRIPRPRVAEPDSTGGRGLFLVSALSDAWKIEPHGGERNNAPGTAVWAEFSL